MFKKTLNGTGEFVRFLGYQKRPPSVGTPSLTKGKLYEIVRDTGNPNYLWIRNDKEVVSVYAKASFEAAVKEVRA